MTDPDSKRGHYFFSLGEGQRFGCGLRKLKPPKGEKWGEVKCVGGAIILGPTNHPDADDGHAYHSGPGGYPEFVPDEIAEKLNALPEPETYRLLTPRELEESATKFIATYTDEKNRGPWLRTWTTSIRRRITGTPACTKRCAGRCLKPRPGGFRHNAPWMS